VKIARGTTDAIGAALPDWLYCASINLRFILRHQPFRLSVSKEGKNYFWNQPGEQLFLARRKRLWRYRKGVSQRISILSRKYMLDRVPMSRDVKIIDCGANVGELGVWAKQYDADYHPFEPEEKEANCCDMNNFSARPMTIRKALWFKEMELKFFSKPETADGSVIEMNGFNGMKIVQTTTLASYISKLPNPSVRLLKIDAEGAEPEVLQGAEGVFQHIDYIAVDCSFERGKKCSSTFLDCNEILRRNDFEVADANLSTLVFLYRRSGLNENSTQ